MEVWRIKRHESNCFISKVFCTRYQAAWGIVRRVRTIFGIKNLDYKKMWTNITPEEIIKLGEYRQEEYGLYWTIESQQYKDNRKETKQIETEEDNSDVWCDNFDILQDGKTYDITLTDGTVTTAIFDEQYGYFYQEDNNEININDVLKFKGR